jgi:cytosine/adenosine deaminase-related metal-dependent hydrolase
VRQLLDAGVNVGIGVDGSASNDCGSLLAETRLAYMLQRAQGTIEGALGTACCKLVVS